VDLRFARGRKCSDLLMPCMNSNRSPRVGAAPRSNRFMLPRPRPNTRSTAAESTVYALRSATVSTAWLPRSVREVSGSTPASGLGWPGRAQTNHRAVMSPISWPGPPLHAPLRASPPLDQQLAAPPGGLVLQPELRARPVSLAPSLYQIWHIFLVTLTVASSSILLCTPVDPRPAAGLAGRVPPAAVVSAPGSPRPRSPTATSLVISDPERCLALLLRCAIDQKARAHQTHPDNILPAFRRGLTIGTDGCPSPPWRRRRPSPTSSPTGLGVPSER